MTFFRRTLASFLALLLATPVAAAPALWKFGDADTTIYLFGTIHALPPGYKWQDARIGEALAKADTLVIETVIDKDPQAIARLFPPPDSSLPPILDRVPAKSRAAFVREVARSGLSQAALDRMPTWQAAFMMMGAMMRHLGIQRDAGVENNIAPAFEAPPAAGGVPRKIEGLETASAQLALFANLSEADQRELLASIVDGQNDARTDYARMLRAWANGDEPAIAKAFADDKDLTPHLREVLLRQRNASWTQWLKTRLATPGTVFVAVGAGHLAGPLSVQAMLEADGIKVERIVDQRPGARPAARSKALATR
ncbi:MAG: TraB/GumN family protein [Sphingomonas sp.]|nr:TraB/GumN family protein [Sphingomonas sp.]